MGQKESASQFNKALYGNTATFQLYYSTLINLALSIFEWEGLPDSVNPRFIEKTLHGMGSAAFVNTETGFLATRVTAAGMVDVYGEPIAYKCYSVNGLFTRDYKADEIVLIRNTPNLMPTELMLQFYAARLTDLEMTITVNLAVQKKPWIILVDEKQRFTWQQIMMKVEGNEDLILGNKSIDPEAVKVFNLNAPYLADKLQTTKEAIINEFYTRLGLNNANTTKRERLIVDEVNANNQVIGLNAETMLHTRQLAAAEINKKFGLHVSVRLRMEGKDNGEIHDDDQDPR